MQKAFTRLKNLAVDEMAIVPRVWWRSQFDWDDTRVRLVLRELEKEECVHRDLETAEETHLRILKPKFPASALRRIRQDFEVQRGERLRRLNEMVDYCRTHKLSAPNNFRLFRRRRNSARPHFLLRQLRQSARCQNCGFGCRAARMDQSA